VISDKLLDGQKMKWLFRPTPVDCSSTHSVTISDALKVGRSRQQRACFSIALVLLVVTLLAAPLPFGSVQPWAYACLSMLAVALLLLWAIGSVQEGVLRIEWSPLLVPLGLFLLLGLIQFSAHLTSDPFSARESLLKLGTDLLIFFLSGQLLALANEKAWRRIGLSVTAFCFILSLFAILQFFSTRTLMYWSVKIPWGGFFGPYVNHNHYAGLMEMVIPLAAGYILSQPADRSMRGWSAVASFVVLVPVASVLLSGSRGGMFSLLFETFVLGTLGLRYAPLCRARGLAIWGITSISAAIWLFLWMDPGQISKRLAVLFERGRQHEEISFVERKTIYMDSFRLLREHPWIGTGLGSFEVAYPRYQSLATDEVVDHAHNDYLEALAETGIVGGAIIVAAIAIFLYHAFWDLGGRLRHEKGWMQIGASLGVCGLLVHSFVDFNLHIPANAAWFAVCAALGSHWRAKFSMHGGTV